MNSFHKSDDILNEWTAITDRAVPPTRAPRPRASGAALKLGFAVGVAALLVAAIVIPQAMTPSPAVVGNTPTASAIVATASPGLATASSSQATASPAPTPSSSPTVNPVVPSSSAIKLTTSGVASDWKGFTWTAHKSGTDDIALLSGPVISWAHGYAITETLGSTPATRVFLSSDGSTWTQAIEAPSVYVANGPAGLLVLTASGTFPMSGFTAWTTQDGAQWTKAGNPGGLDGMTRLVGNSHAYLATTSDGSGKFAVLRSTDGVRWSELTPEPGLKWADTELAIHSAAGRLFLSGDVAAGTARGGATKGAILASGAMPGVTWWSDDGAAWTRASGLDGAAVYDVEGTAGGLLLQTVFAGTPGGVGFFWSHDGGATWQADSNFGPLGMAKCQGECSVVADGVIASNGSIFLAVKSGGRAWTSIDGKSWQPIAWTSPAPAAPETVVLLPRGVIFEYRSGYTGTAPTPMYGAAK